MIFKLVIGFMLTIICMDFSTSDYCKPTTADVLGPYYYPNPPKRRQICEKDPSFGHAAHLLVRGRVLNEKCRPLMNTKIEVWQADHGGHYLFRDKCRGYLKSGPGGHYAFMTIHPGKYSTDPKRELFRPSHVHFRVVAQGYDILVTQMYFKGDPSLGRNDSCTRCSSDKRDLIVNPARFCADNFGHYCFEMVNFDLILRAGNGTDVIKDIDDSSVELTDLVFVGK